MLLAEGNPGLGALLGVAGFLGVAGIVVGLLSLLFSVGPASFRWLAVIGAAVSIVAGCFHGYVIFNHGVELSRYITPLDYLSTVTNLALGIANWVLVWKRRQPSQSP